MIGKVFGNIEVVRFATPGGRLVIGRCVCGSEKPHEARHIKSGRIRSCGCNPDAMKGDVKRMYRIWQGIKQRCLNPLSRDYAGYGGRGIRVSLRWRRSFWAFLADMGTRPSVRHSVGRKDNDGPYCADNCEWQLPDKQTRNMRSNVWIQIGNERLTVTDWCKRFGVKRVTAYWRISQGWDPVKAVSTKGRDILEGK